MEIQLSFQELRKKDVINLADGRRLGRIIDMVFNVKGHILGLVTPGFRRFLFFKSCDDIFIRWCDIKKIGDDCILVDLRPDRVTPHTGCDPCHDFCSDCAAGHCSQHHGTGGGYCSTVNADADFYYCSEQKNAYAARPKYYYASSASD